MLKIHLQTIVFLFLVGVLIVNCKTGRETIEERTPKQFPRNASQYYDDACEDYSWRGKGWDPRKVQNYGCRFACRPMLFSRKGLPDRFPCGGSDNNWCINKKCYKTACVKKCIKLVGSTTITRIYRGKNKHQNLIYCATNVDFLRLGPKWSYNATAADDYGCELPNQDNSTINTKILDPPSTCKGANSGNLKDMRIWNNGCYFTCQSPNITDRSIFVQPNGLACGDGKECLNGECSTTASIKECKKILTDTILYAIRLVAGINVDNAECRTDDQTSGISFPTNSSFYPGENIEDDDDRNWLCDGIDNVIALTQDSAQSLCKAKNSKATKAEVVNCGCRYMCRSSDGKNVYSDNNVNDGTPCGTNATCLSGQCKRISDISSCTAALKNDKLVRVRRANCMLYCFTGNTGAPKTTVALTEKDCPGNQGILDPPTTCKTDMQNIKIWNNGCYFTCKNGKRYNQPNGMQCGINKECYNGKCYTSDCIAECKRNIGPKYTLSYINLVKKGTEARCHVKGRVLNKARFPLNDTFTCGNNVEDDQDGTKQCDGNNAIVAISVNNAQAQCDTKNAGKNTKVEVLNCGCRYNCRSINGKRVISQSNVDDLTACGTNSACLSGECKRQSDITRCQTALGTEKLVRITRQYCSLSCYTKLRGSPKQTVQLGVTEC